MTVFIEKKPDPAADPDPGSPFAKLDEALRETLKNSFLDRIGKVADANENLDNAFWSGPPATTWEALERFRPMCVNLIVRLFDRIKAIDPSLDLWREIKYLKNFWYGGSAGAKVVYKDPKSVRLKLDSLFKNRNGGEMARDKYIGGLEHQKKSSIELVAVALDPKAKLPDCDTWREVYKPGDESVHFCVAKSDLEENKTASPPCDMDYHPPAVVPTRSPTLDDVHIDWKSPVVGVDLVTQTCEYDAFFNSADHWLQAKLGLGTPVFTFQVVEEQIDTLDTWVMQSFGTSVDADIRDFAKRWNTAKWDLAVQGKSGYEASMKYYEEGNRLLDRMSIERADPTKTPAY